MSKVLAIFRRELFAYFFSPLAYVFTMAFVLATGWAFFLVAATLSQAAVLPRANPLSSVYFGVVLYILTIIIPSITMRLLSEDLRTGSIELLLTAPVREGEVVLGKFFGALAFYILMLSPTAVFVAMAASYATPALDLGPVFAGYFGFVGIGALLISMGLFVSAFCKNQIVAFIFTAVAILLMQLLPGLKRMATGTEGFVATVGRVADYVAYPSHFTDLGRGIVDLRHVVLYLSVTALFLFATTVVLNLRKAR
jgi:ABC-2 type transport system permease protein